MAAQPTRPTAIDAALAQTAAIVLQTLLSQPPAVYDSEIKFPGVKMPLNAMRRSPIEALIEIMDAIETELVQRAERAQSS